MQHITLQSSALHSNEVIICNVTVFSFNDYKRIRRCNVYIVYGLMFRCESVEKEDGFGVSERKVKW